MKPTSIDLFAGCGGLSLGLEQAGFETVFANELHPVALGTYLLNRPGQIVQDPKRHCNDIAEVTRSGDGGQSLARWLRREHGDIGLVAGGPPCQGYSGIGHRRTFKVQKEEIPSNHLYRDMAAFVAALAPRAFLFENVKGLVSSRWTSVGEKGEIWQDVRDAFEQITVKVGRRRLQYSIGWALLHAKDFGVPQNRPRVFMVGLREDISFSPSDSPGNGLLPEATGGAPNLVDLLGDLIDPNWQPGGETEKYLTDPLTDAQHRLRTTLTGTVLRKGDGLTEHEYGNHSEAMILKFQHMILNNGEIPDAFKTKKFAQRVLPKTWPERGPTITATSLPDDYVHFSQPRVPTVREWARLQTFPDWYQFAGRRTTGGRRRAGDPSQGVWARDLPKYTQIGNAVAVALAQQIGLHLKSLIAE